tara:strand:- start:591 stop:1190 length:600 start_codon:yes stop_codon:yes gene_type:complete
MRFSKILSFVFHPVLMPTYAILLLLYFSKVFSQFMPIEQKTHLINLTLIFTLLLPLLGVFLLKKLKIVSSIYMENQKERKWPLLIAISSYYLLFRMFEFLYIHPIIIKLVLGAMLILFLAVIISNFWKISLHMLGIGGVFGAFLAFQYLFGGKLFLIILLLLCSGLVAYARINENAHTLKQVYLGFLVGASVEFLIFYF